MSGGSYDGCDDAVHRRMRLTQAGKDEEKQHRQ